MQNFERLQLDENFLRGQYSSAVTGNITVMFDLEEESPGLDHFDGLVKEASAWIQTLTKEILDDLKRQMATELTDSAYAELQYEPTADDYKKLEEELTLKEIRFFPDSMYSLVLEAKKEYPDMLIYCQIGEDFEIEDLEVNQD